MDWINLHTSTLDSVEFLGSEPVDRATWLCLLRYCCGQENGGIIREAADWGDRRWQQLCRVMLLEVKRDCALWTWFGRDLHVHAYPRDKEREVQSNRIAGRQGGLARTQAKTEAARLNGAKHQPKQEAKPNPSENPTEGKGMEGNGREGATQPPPIPFSGKIDTSTLLATFGLPNGPKDTAEWRGGLSKVARCRSEAEARAFLTWAISACNAQGVTVVHWRHVRLLAMEWDSGMRAEHFNNSPREDAQ